MVKCVVKLKKLLDQNKIWCGTRYGPRDYDSGDKKTKRQKGKNAKRQKMQKGKNTTTTKKIVVKCVVKLKKCWIIKKNWCVTRYGPRDYDSGEKKK